MLPSSTFLAALNDDVQACFSNKHRRPSLHPEHAGLVLDIGDGGWMHCPLINDQLASEKSDQCSRFPFRTMMG
jgi:hypothetical protein